MSLTAATEVRTANALTKYRRDSVTGELYTLRARAQRKQIHAIVQEITDGEITSYGYIHKRDAESVSYLTDIFNMPKLAYTFMYNAGLPVMVLDHDTFTLERGLSKADNDHLFGKDR